MSKRTAIRGDRALPWKGLQVVQGRVQTLELFAAGVDEIRLQH